MIFELQLQGKRGTEMEVCRKEQGMLWELYASVWPERRLESRQGPSHLKPNKQGEHFVLYHGVKSILHGM